MSATTNNDRDSRGHTHQCHNSESCVTSGTCPRPLALQPDPGICALGHLPDSGPQESQCVLLSPQTPPDPLSSHTSLGSPTIQAVGWVWDMRSRKSPVCACVSSPMKLLRNPDPRSASPAQEAADTLGVPKATTPKPPGWSCRFCDLEE